VRALHPRDLRGEAGWPADAVIVASLGRLAAEKSPMDVLDALALADDPRLHLVMVGGGPSEDELRRRAAAPDVAGRAWLTGGLPRPDALATIAGADLFMFTSRTETQGLVLAEALSAGLPAVAIDGPGVRDSVRDGVDGLVVAAKPADGRAGRLATALAAVAADDQRRTEMARRAKKDADRFAIERRIDELESLYRALLA
jgi:1,2-diacylglycerol 3-alpha-glucosyltransferase